VSRFPSGAPSSFLIASTWFGSTASDFPVRRLTMASAGSPGCSRGIRKLRVIAAQSVAMKKPVRRRK
jgi:hypothetical protein